MFKTLEKYYNHVTNDNSYFIAQIPEFPKSPILKNKYCYADEAINMYLIASTENKIALKTFLNDLNKQQDCIDLGAKKIITFFGSGNVSDIYDSSYIDRALLKILLSQTHSKEIILQYQPHPTNKPSDFFKSFLGTNNIHIIKNLNVSCIISAGAVALMSAALFEARYFGCLCFTPTLKEDGIFLDEYFNLVTNPDIGTLKSLESALHNYIISIIKDGQTIDERLEEISIE